MCDRQQPTEGADSPPKSRKTITLAVMLTLALAACAAPTPDPTASAPATPEPTLAPTPSPETVEVEVEVVPDACIDALDAAETALVASNAFTVDALLAYVEYPDENLEQFGGRVEELISEFDQDSWSAVIEEFRSLSEACEEAR